jgi:hypothetical protein
MRQVTGPGAWSSRRLASPRHQRRPISLAARVAAGEERSQEAGLDIAVLMLLPR